MKLASLRGGRDGRLVVVSKDLTRAVEAAAVAPTLQAALDDWAQAAQRLAELAEALEAGRVPDFRFREHECLSPLPRAFQWADGSAYVNHVALVRKARGAEMPPSFWSDPLIYQGGSDAFLAPCEAIPFLDEKFGLDLEAEVAVVTDDVPLGVSAGAALAHVALAMLVNDVTLRGLTASELAKGFGFFQSKPASAFSPVAVTPDELGAAWRGGKLALPLLSFVNDAPLGRPDAGCDMTFDFGALIAHAARTRALAAGTIIGSGTVSNRAADGGPGRPIADGGLGYSCIAEQRVVETLRGGAPRTPFLKPGDRVRIEMRDGRGQSIFGAIEQVVAARAM
ncbi:fumarylacetoacetate hydrolase family protein [Methylosinus sp. Sm6]|uniref:fumarylacetoacetate hydrolase family protein n=1 Tax=Methylosinus sp. Sm6 TaxID=2866948 RepID=UPI001C98ECFE|nr:fumarylacetoacetate hydrolase family protein [Methylosinus sp. Sm6]MBY6242114.1 fumarylacetoacetate hydrolase family protein [Methylosinus sp. Sm6]